MSHPVSSYRSGPRGRCSTADTDAARKRSGRSGKCPVPRFSRSQGAGRRISIRSNQSGSPVQGNARCRRTLPIPLALSCRACGEFPGILTPALAIHTYRRSFAVAFVIRSRRSASLFNHFRSRRSFRRTAGTSLGVAECTSDPYCLFGPVFWLVTNSRVPSRCACVFRLPRQSLVQVNATGQPTWVPACHVPAMPVFQGSNALAICAVHRGATHSLRFS